MDFCFGAHPLLHLVFYYTKSYTEKPCHQKKKKKKKKKRKKKKKEKTNKKKIKIHLPEPPTKDSSSSHILLAGKVEAVNLYV